MWVVGGAAGRPGRPGRTLSGGIAPGVVGGPVAGVAVRRIVDGARMLIERPGHRVLRLGGVWPPGRRDCPVAGNCPSSTPIRAGSGRAVWPGMRRRSRRFTSLIVPYRCVAVGRRGRAASGTRTRPYCTLEQ